MHSFRSKYPQKSCVLFDLKYPKSVHSFRSKYPQKSCILYDPKYPKNACFLYDSRYPEKSCSLYYHIFQQQRLFFSIQCVYKTFQKVWFLQMLIAYKFLLFTIEISNIKILRSHPMRIHNLFLLFLNLEKRIYMMELLYIEFFVIFQVRWSGDFRFYDLRHVFGTLDSEVRVSKRSDLSKRMPEEQ